MKEIQKKKTKTLVIASSPPTKTIQKILVKKKVLRRPCQMLPHNTSSIQGKKA